MSEIAELYAKDPMELTKTDIDALIADLRSRRHKLKLGDKNAGRTTPNPKALANLDIKGLLDAKKPGEK